MAKTHFKYVLSACLIACAVFSAGAAFAGEPDLVVLTPRDRSVVRSRTISVVAKSPSKAFDQIAVTLNGSKLLLAASGKTLLCHNGLNLTAGMNRISVAGLKGGKILVQRELSVFLKTVFRSGSDAPDDFKPYIFHAPESEARCNDCHSCDFEDTTGFPAAPQQSPCFNCHRKMLADYKFVHRPSAAWACYMCHRRKPSDGETSALEGNSRACRTCHAETLTSWQKQKFRHGPTDAWLCVVCHSPHGSDFRYFLRKETVNLCTSCHEKETLQPHVISGGGHPLRVDEEQARMGMGMTITCTSCHSPHAGNNRRVLKGYRGSLTTFCLRCHGL